MKRVHKVWTPDEEAQLRDAYTAGTQVHIIAQSLNRTVGSLMKRLEKLRVNRPKDQRPMRAGAVRWTQAHDSTLKAMYPTDATMAEILAAVPHSAHSIRKRAILLGVNRPDKRGPYQIGIYATVLDLAARPCGIDSAGFGVDVKRGHAILSRLRSRGQLFSASLSPRVQRFFTSRQAADQWATVNLPGHLNRRTSNAITIKKAGAKAGWGRDAPMIVTPQTKFTFAPPPVYSFRTNTYTL